MTESNDNSKMADELTVEQYLTQQCDLLIMVSSADGKYKSIVYTILILSL